MEKMFDQALSFMKREDLLDQFNNRAAKILKDSNGTGWGFYESLCDIYCDFYEITEENDEKHDTINEGKVIPLRKV